MRRAVAIAIVGALAGLPGCADDSGGPGVAPPPDPSLKADAPPKAPAPTGGRAARSAVTTRPSATADAMKTGMP